MSGSFVLGAWGENSIFFEPVGRTQGPVRVTVQSKDSAPTPPFALRLVAEGPRNAPTKVVLVAEDLPTQSAEERLKDQVIEALTTLTPVEAVTGKSGVPLSAIVEALHRKSDKPVRKVLKALQDDKRVEIVGKADKQADLFAVIAQ